MVELIFVPIEPSNPLFRNETIYVFLSMLFTFAMAVGEFKTRRIKKLKKELKKLKNELKRIRKKKQQ